MTDQQRQDLQIEQLDNAADRLRKMAERIELVRAEVVQGNWDMTTEGIATTFDDNDRLEELESYLSEWMEAQP
jgi:hypothetical protein